MKPILKLLFLLLFTGCKSEKDYRKSFDQWNYDTTFVNHLPEYDSLRKIVVASIDSFHLSELKYSFSYVYNFDTVSHQISGYSNSDLPVNIFPVVTDLIQKLGKNNISGFMISKDSSFEVFLRITHLQEYYLDVRERLEWKSDTRAQQKSEFPFKDSSLTDNWRYRIWFDKRAEF